MATNLIKKVSIATVFGDVEAIRNAATEQGAAIVRFAGIANGFRSGQNKTTGDEWTGLKGQFRGVNLKTGEVFEGIQCFMPEVATQLVVNALFDVQGDDARGTVEFGFDVVVKKDKTSATGYTYSVNPLVEAKEASPLDALMGGMPELPKLEAPKAEEKAAKK